MSKECACVYFDNGKCKKFSNSRVTSWCVEGPCEDKTPSNADRIRAMSDEELERFLKQYVWECETYNDCAKCPRMTDDGCVGLLQWLKQPAEE